MTSPLSAGGRQKILTVLLVAVVLAGASVLFRALRVATQAGGASSYDRVRAILIRRLGVDPGRAGIREPLGPPQGVNSVDRQELAAALADELGVSISDEEAMGLQSVEDVVRLVDARRAEAAP